ncbi:sugar transport family protein [Clostridioides difficile CD160]|nr:sugar transport family protein [Clostridioides difficile CD160]
MLTIIIALLPVIGWGLMPIVANLKKSSPYEQLLGTSISAFIFSTIITLVMRPEITFFSFFVSMISGIFWSLGQLMQFKAIQITSVSKVMPISNGSQLTFTTLLAVLLFNEWTSSKMFLIGSSSILCIVLGILLTNYQTKKSTDNNILKCVGVVLLSSLFLALYVVTNQIFSIEGYRIILPQSVGMLITSFIIVKYFSKEIVYKKNVSFNLITGVLWSIANLGMFITTNALGVTISFSISQSCVIVSTLGGIIFFKEKKNKKEWFSISLGIILIMFGVLILSIIK